MRKMAPESGGRAPTIDTASGWALAKAFTLWRTVGPGGAAAGSSKAPMARVLRAREKSGRRRNMAASRSALKGDRSKAIALQEVPTGEPLAIQKQRFW